MSSRKTIVTLISLGALAATAGAGALAAAAHAENDALQAPRPTISLTAAVRTAEQRASGYAVQAEYEQVNSGWAYDIEVVSGRNVQEVRVDASTGQVLSVQQDDADEANESGEQDDKD